MQREHGWIGRKDRDAVSLDAVVYRDEGEGAPVMVTNLTDEGCRIEAEHHFRIGERFEIAIPGVGRMSAQVRWALHHSAGAKFVNDQA